MIREINKMNRRGDERVLSIYWFIIFGIIAIGIVSGILLFYSKPLDVRAVESGILADKVIDCFVDNGQLIEEKVRQYSGLREFGDECGLVFSDNTHIDYSDEQFYVEVLVNSQEIKAGNEDFKRICGTASKDKNIPVCSEKRLMVLNGNDFVRFDVLTAVRKVEQNAK